MKFSMIIFWRRANVLRRTCIVHADFHSCAYVHRPLKWICKKSTANLLCVIMWNLVWEYFVVQQKFPDLIASCVLIFIVVHTCKYPLNAFAKQYCLSIGQKYVEFFRMIHLSTGNTFWSTHIVHESCTRTQTPKMNLISHTSNFWTEWL